VVSPESVRRLQDPARLTADAFGTLGASHLLLLRGHLGGSGTLALQMELLARDSPRALWSERLAVTLDGLLSGEAPSLRRALAYQRAEFPRQHAAGGHSAVHALQVTPRSDGGRIVRPQAVEFLRHHCAFEHHQQLAFIERAAARRGN